MQTIRGKWRAIDQSNFEESILDILFKQLLRDRIVASLLELPKVQRRKALNKMEETAEAGGDIIDLGTYDPDDPIFDAGVDGSIWVLGRDEKTRERKVLWECETLKYIFQNEKMVKDLKADMGYSVG